MAPLFFSRTVVILKQHVVCAPIVGMGAAAAAGASRAVVIVLLAVLAGRSISLPSSTLACGPLQHLPPLLPVLLLLLFPHLHDQYHRLLLFQHQLYHH